MKRLAILFALVLSGCDRARAPTCDVSQLTVSMTVEEVINRCGKPYKINGSSYSEQWVYDQESYIYIEDGHFRAAQWTRHP